MKTSKYNFFLFLLLALFIVEIIAIDPVYAQSKQSFPVGYTIGDGNDGRIFKQWQGSVKNQPISTVEVRLRKEKGGRDVYVNLRFGNGSTIDGSKRIALEDNTFQNAIWNVDGDMPNGKDLILNVYNGEAYVESVTVTFADNKFRANRPIVNPGLGLNSNQSDNSSGFIGSQDQDNEMIRRCRNMYRIGYPRIEVGRINPSGGFFSTDQRVQGSIYAQCVQEAGYFEYGRLKDSIEFPLNDSFIRRDFSVKVRSGRNGEIRVYTTDGQVEAYRVE